MTKIIPNLLVARISPSGDEIQQSRNKLMAWMLLVAGIVGTGTYIYYLYISFRQRSGINTLIIITFVYIGLLSISFFQRFPSRVRGAVGLLYIYGFGLYSTLQRGATGGTYAWWFGFVICAALWFHLPVGIIASFLSTATLFITWYINQDPSGQGFNSLADWLSPTLPYFIVGMIAVFSTHYLIHNMSRGLRSYKETLQDLKSNLDQHKNRIRNLELHQSRLQTAVQLSHTIHSDFETESLLNRVVKLLKEKFGLYFAGIFTVDQDGRFAIYKAGTSMFEAGYKLPIDDSSTIGWVISHRKGKIFPDVGVDSVRFEYPSLPHARLELVLPMISHEKILGAITLLSEQTDAFDEDDLVVFQVIANSIGSVYERRLLVEEINHYLEEMKRLDRRYRSQIWADNPPGLDGMSYAYQGNVDHSDGDESRLPIEKKIVLRDQILGKITLEADRRDWDVQDEAFIEAVAAQTALALENVRLLEATQITAHHNRIVADLSNKIGASADLDNILKTTLEELVNELQASNGLIHLEIPPLFSPDERGSPQSS